MLGVKEKLRSLWNFFKGNKKKVVSAATALTAIAAWYLDLLPKEKAIKIIFEMTGISL